MLLPECPDCGAIVWPWQKRAQFRDQEAGDEEYKWHHIVCLTVLLAERRVRKIEMDLAYCECGNLLCHGWIRRDGTPVECACGIHH